MKNFTLLIFGLFAFSVLSCQDDGQSVVQDTANNFTKTSPISSLINRVSQYETTADNILDGTSDCSVKLPVQVTVNSQYVYVFSNSDFQTIQDIKNQSSSDDDKIHFGYPITIVYPNYQEYNVSSETQFENILAGYGDDSAFHEVSCLDFKYPIGINMYNTNNQVANTVKIQSDVQFNSFINNLNESQIVSIVFPIAMKNSTTEQIIINNNNELENAINVAVTSCSSVSNSSSLDEILATSTWHVSYYFEDHDETFQFSGYNFTFNANGTSMAVNNTTTIFGDWSIHDTMPQHLDLHFDGSELEHLETNWDVQEFTSTYIRLKGQNSGGGPGPGSQQSSYLSFTKNQ